jgi:predicted RND superfamily exporter protein
MVAGAIALAGVPGRITPMKLETDALAYIDPSLPLARDMRRFESSISGLSSVQVWVTTPTGEALRPDLLRGYEVFARRVEDDPRVGSVSGPTTLLRWMEYVTRGSDRLPDDAGAWARLSERLDTLLLENPESRGYVDVGTLSNVRLEVIYRGEDFRDVTALREFLRERWAQAAGVEPGLAACRLRVVGRGLLQARIAEHLVPTLTESFAITAVLIFAAFLVVFRSAAARLMAMIPSVFAILVMFLVMRLTGISLNVATILIASTVLGASENDQIHFFYHLQEARRPGRLEAAMHHALRIAGRGILFATLINAGGFLALALSRLPPMRQFGIMASSAFVLSMLASLVSLPAALWVFSGDDARDRTPRS